MNSKSVSLSLALGSVALALVIALIWVPMDSGSGFVVQSRGKLAIGDAFAPMVASGLILIAGLLIFFFERSDDTQPGYCGAGVRFILCASCICA
ncbi:MAG: hypothetical protein HRU30_20325, partial [Rhodobacteraceae bacterium]|nr:hypothetical protein [Paracoccaceae bacterium]